MNKAKKAKPSAAQKRGQAAKKRPAKVTTQSKAKLVAHRKSIQPAYDLFPIVVPNAGPKPVTRWGWWALWLFLILFNVVVLLVVYEYYLPRILSFTAPPAQRVETATSVQRTRVPTKITIPKIGVNLPIVEAEIRGQVWQTSRTAVAHLDISPRPGEAGNIVLYGHNWRGLLHRLPELAVGDVFQVSSADGRTHFYRIFSTQRVKPDQVTVIQPTSTEVVTLYTCDGFLDSLRFVVQAKPIIEPLE